MNNVFLSGGGPEMTDSGPAATGSKWKECMNEEVTIVQKEAGRPLPFNRPTTVAALEERRGERKAKQKTLFRQREKSSLHIKHEARQIQAPQIPSPSLAGQTETIIRQVSWLQPFPLRHLPMLAHSGTAGSLAVTVAGPRRTPTGFPIKSYNT